MGHWFNIWDPDSILGDIGFNIWDIYDSIYGTRIKYLGHGFNSWDRTQYMDHGITLYGTYDSKYGTQDSISGTQNLKYRTLIWYIMIQYLVHGIQYRGHFSMYGTISVRQRILLYIISPSRDKKQSQTQSRTPSGVTTKEKEKT